MTEAPANEGLRIRRDADVTIQAALAVAILEYLNTCPRGAVNQIASALEEAVQKTAQGVATAAPDE